MIPCVPLREPQTPRPDPVWVAPCTIIPGWRQRRPDSWRRSSCGWGGGRALRCEEIDEDIWVFDAVTGRYPVVEAGRSWEVAEEPKQ